MFKSSCVCQFAPFFSWAHFDHQTVKTLWSDCRAMLRSSSADAGLEVPGAVPAVSLQTNSPLSELLGGSHSSLTEFQHRALSLFCTSQCHVLLAWIDYPFRHTTKSLK